MQEIKVTAQRGDDPPVDVNYDMAENLNELAQQFGEEIVFGHAKRSIVIALQGYMRTLMDKGKEDGKSQAEVVDIITEAVKGWKPSQKKAPMSTADKAKDILSRLSPSEREALLNEYRGKAKKQPVAA
jgi:hypothetical protein